MSDVHEVCEARVQAFFMVAKGLCDPSGPR